MSIDGIECAEGVDESGAGVHGHGDAEGLRDFLFRGARFEGCVGVKGDATIAASGDSHGKGNELTGFFAEERGFGVSGGEDLVAAERVGRELGEVGDGFGKFGLIIVPIEEHGVSSRENRCGEAV